MLGNCVGVVTTRVAKFYGDPIVFAFLAVEADYLFESIPLFGAFLEIIGRLFHLVQRVLDCFTLLSGSATDIHASWIKKAERVVSRVGIHVPLLRIDELLFHDMDGSGDRKRPK